MKRKQHKGQVALVLVLIMTVASALAVSLASRSTIDTRIQKTESDSVQALILAQTGLEQMIANPSGVVVGDGYSAVRSAAGGDSLITGRVESGASVEINLSGSDFGMLTGFVVNWGPDSANPTGEPAILISLVRNNNVIDDTALDYLGANGFTLAADNVGIYEKTSGNIPLNNTVEKIRITVFGSPAVLQILPLGTGIFPSQLVSIRSTGSVVADDASVKYGLQYDESAGVVMPGIFDYAMFSGGSIVQ